MWDRRLRDVMDIRNFLSSSTIVSMCEIFWAPIFFIFLFMMHPYYGIVGTVGVIGLIGFGILNDVVTRRALMLAQDKVSRSNSHIALALRNAETIEAMGMMPQILRRWSRVNKDAQRALAVEHDRSNLVSSASRFFRLILICVMVAVGVMLVINERTSTGHIIAAVILLGRGLTPFEELIDRWRDCLRIGATVSRLRDLTRTGGDSGTPGLPLPTGALEVTGLSFTPPRSPRPVLNNVTFRAEPGEVIAITGHSGAGKSTLARLLMGVFEPTAGTIRLDGRDVSDWKREDLGQALGYLPQDVGLFDCSVRDNIARLFPADPAEVVAAARRADVHEMVGRLPFGYDTPIGEGGFVLTGGQRQRVALARAFFGNPHFIVLDEPDASLDQAGEAALIACIREARKGGAIVLVASHRRAVVNIADKLLVLNLGEVEHFGPRQEIIAAVQGGRPRTPSILRLASAGEAVVAGE